MTVLPFALRTGLTTRTTLPAWAARVQNRSATLAANQYGPSVGTGFLLGHYIEDFDYLGDLGQVQGTHFDLNEQNARFCVTPEFPSGTWAYFTPILADGTPQFPYTTGRQFYADPTGGAVTTISEPVSTAILAGLWKVEPARDTLVALLTDAKTIPAIRDGATRGLTALGGVKSRDLFDKLFTESQDNGLRALMIDGLTSVGPQLAAKRAVEFLAKAEVDAAKPILTVFLKNKQLPGVLAKELEGKTILDSVAVEGIRMVTSRGIQGPLAEALKKAGGVKQMDRPLTPEEMSAMVAKVKTQGDPARGEAVYRRQQMLCTTCHAIGESGGVLGPNLVSIGASAPVDYLIESLLEPSKKIKEGYHMVIISKKDGGVISGGLINDGAEELTIRDPANQIVKVAKSGIASRQMSPVSMMPPGLTASLREDEFVDLVRFLSELGREGAYKTQPNRYVRTWKAMGKMEQKDVDHVRHVGSFALNDDKHPFPWQMALSQVNGDLPLADLPEAILVRRSLEVTMAELAAQRRKLRGAARLDRLLETSELDLRAADWTLAGWFKRNAAANMDVIAHLGASGGFGSLASLIRIARPHSPHTTPPSNAQDGPLGSGLDFSIHWDMPPLYRLPLQAGVSIAGAFPPSPCGTCGGTSPDSHRQHEIQFLCTLPAQIIVRQTFAAHDQLHRQVAVIARRAALIEHAGPGRVARVVGEFNAPGAGGISDPNGHDIPSVTSISTQPRRACEAKAASITWFTMCPSAKLGQRGAPSAMAARKSRCGRPR